MTSKHRRLLSARVGAEFTGPIVAVGGARAARRVGVLASGAPGEAALLFAAFAGELERLGWIRGRDLELVFRYARGDLAAHERVARELLAERVELIFAPFGPAPAAARRATRELPIVFANLSDPVAEGLAASLLRPGGNATGAVTRYRHLHARRIAVFREAFPRLRRVALLFNPAVNREIVDRFVLPAMRALRLASVETPIGGPGDLEAAFAAIAGARAGGIFVIEDPALVRARAQLLEQVARSGLPACYSVPHLVEGGGLMSLAVDLIAQYRRAAGYVDRILRGARPGELAIRGPERFQLTLNLAAARAAGLAFPQALIARADRIIE